MIIGCLDSYPKFVMYFTNPLKGHKSRQIPYWRMTAMSEWKGDISSEVSRDRETTIPLGGVREGLHIKNWN